MISNEAENAACAPKRRKPRARKVYVAEWIVSCEGSGVIGVYSTKRRAEKAVERCQNTSWGGAGKCGHDDHAINEHKLNE